MDVTELRSAILSHDTIRQRLEEFRLNRLTKIAADPTLNDSAKIVLHFQPVESAREDFEIDLARVRLEDLMLMRFDQVRSEKRRNFDGLLAYQERGQNQANTLRSGYIQVFRSGAIEEVDAHILPLMLRERPGVNLIPSVKCEGDILNGVPRRLALFKSLDMVSPILLHLSLLSVKGYVMWVENLGQGPRDLTGLHTTGLENPIDRNDLLLRGVMLDDLAGIATDRLFQY